MRINPSNKYVFDKLFFLLHQKLLLKFANSFIGKWFFKIHGKRSSIGKKKISKIAPNFIEWENSNKTTSREFRTHNKFTKRLYHGLYPIWWLMHQWDTLIANNYFPELNLGFDTLTVYPDANPESTSVDGWVLHFSSNDTWANIRDGAGTGADDSSDRNFTVGVIRIESDSTTDRWKNIYRGIFLFDTSSIGSGATISSATLSLDGILKGNSLGASPAVNIYSSDPASNTALASGDYDSLGTTAFSSSISYNSWSASYNDFSLNASGLANISKTGVSKFGAREANYDVADSPPSWIGNANLYFEVSLAETTGTSTDPKLVVTYTAGTNITVTPSAQNLTSATQSETVSAVKNVSITPSQQNASFTAQSATVSTTGLDVIANIKSDWYDPSWQYRVKITIQSSKVDSNLTNFPVFVDLSDLPADFHSNVKSDGGDIRITTSDGETECPREIVDYDATGDTGELHFKAPSISSSSNTDFYIYYGNSGASDYAVDATNGANNVWPSSYSYVYHLEEDPSLTNPAYKDSTGNSNDLNTTSAVSGDQVTGKIGNAYEVDGSNDYSNQESNDTSLNGVTTATLSAWFNKDSGNSDYARILFKGSGTNDRFAIALGGAGVGSTAGILANCGNGGNGYAFKDNLFSNDTWHFVQVVFNGSGLTDADKLKVYVDGVEITGLTYSNIPTSIATLSAPFYVGRDNGTIYFNGTVDETRVLTTNLSSDWILAEYENQNSSSTFYTIGTQEDSTTFQNSVFSTLSPTIVLDTATNVTVNANTINLTTAQLEPQIQTSCTISPEQINITSEAQQVNLLYDYLLEANTQNASFAIQSPEVQTGTSVEQNQQNASFAVQGVTVLTQDVINISANTQNADFNTLEPVISTQFNELIDLELQNASFTAQSVNILTSGDISYQVNTQNSLFETLALTIITVFNQTITPSQQNASFNQEAVVVLTDDSISISADTQNASFIAESPAIITATGVNIQPDEINSTFNVYSPAVTTTSNKVIQVESQNLTFTVNEALTTGVGATVAQIKLLSITNALCTNATINNSSCIKVSDITNTSQIRANVNNA